MHFGIIRKNAIIVHPMLTGARYFTSPRGLRFKKDVFYGSAWASLAPSRAQFGPKGVKKCFSEVSKSVVFFRSKWPSGGHFCHIGPERAKMGPNRRLGGHFGSFGPKIGRRAWHSSSYVIFGPFDAQVRPQGSKLLLGCHCF